MFCPLIEISNRIHSSNSFSLFSLLFSTNRDRLKQRQELLKLQKKAADSTNVSSAASVASSVDNGVMSFEAFDDSQG